MDWEGIRREFPLLEDVAYFNSCSQGALSNRVEAALLEYVRSWKEGGAPWGQWADMVVRSRASFGHLVGAPPETISVHGSFTATLTAFLGALLASDTDRRKVLVDGLSFPTVAHAVRAHEPLGIQTVVVEPVEGATGPDVWEHYLDESVLLACVNEVHYETGRLSPVSAICEKVRAYGACSFVDVYQSIGTHPVDVGALGADALATGTLKFLLGTPGLAYLYVRPEVTDRSIPPATGWLGQADPFAMDFRLDPAPGARRFEGGTWPIPAIYAAAVTLPWIRELDPGAIRERIQSLMGHLLKGCRERGLQTRGPQDVAELGAIVSIGHPDPPAAVEALAEKQIMTTPRGGGVRLSLHFYNTEEDIDRAVEALSSMRPGAR